jgi:hypothetical protein
MRAPSRALAADASCARQPRRAHWQSPARSHSLALSSRPVCGCARSDLGSCAWNEIGARRRSSRGRCDAIGRRQSDHAVAQQSGVRAAPTRPRSHRPQGDAGVQLVAAALAGQAPHCANSQCATTCAWAQPVRGRSPRRCSCDKALAIDASGLRAIFDSHCCAMQSACRLTMAWARFHFSS